MKKLIIAILLLLSCNVLYAQGRGVPSNMKGKIWKAMQEDMRKRQQKQEKQHESTVRNAQAAQRSDRQIRETREDAAFLNDYYQPDNYISGPNYDDISDFSSVYYNTNNSERLSMLENDGEEPSSSVDLIDASSLKQPGSSSSIVIDPDKPFSFRQESQWTEALEEEYGQKWIVPYEMEQKGIVYTAMDADVWDGFKSSLGERQRDMLVINLMQLNDGVLPKFVCYGDKGEYIMENKNGEKYIISADGGSIAHVSDEENSIIENWKKMWDEKKFYKGDYGWKGSKGEAYLKVTLANGQTEHERNWIAVGEVLTVSGGGSLAYGLKVAAKGGGKIELPSISKVYDELQVKYPDKPKKLDESDDGIKSNLLSGKVEAEGKATLAEAGVGLGAGFTVKAFDKYFVVKAHGSVKGEVGIGASWSAKGEVMSGNKILSGKVSPEIVYGLGGKVTVAPEIYVYDVAELHQKIPSRL